MPSYESCVHGYVPGSCAECRHAQVSPLTTEEEIAARQAQITAELSRMDADPVAREDTHGELRDRLIAELDALRTERQLLVRSAVISRGRAVMADPANREGPDSGSQPGAPALVKGLGDRLESAGETLQRMASNPWRGQDGGPLAGHTTYGGVGGESGSGLVSRAQTALEGLEPVLTHDGCEKWAQALSESGGWPGMTVKRSRDEQADAAALCLALSNPHYFEAFRAAMRYPSEFVSGGVGFETLSPDQRQAWRDVRSNEACRTAFAETSGAVGAYALPLQLDPNIVLTNVGVVGPFRKLARTIIGTSNVWEGISSAGTTANWVAEGATVSDTTPSLAQLAITPYKEAVWIYGSFEAMTDTDLASQIPALIDDARSRLELTAFTTGSGSAQPYGAITRGASDSTTGALTAAMVYGLHENLPPRFRSYDTAKPAWIANVAIMDALRQLPQFTGSVAAMLNDNTQPGDNPPMVLGLPIYEASVMSALNVASDGAKNLALGDFSQFIIVDRQPVMLIMDPLVLGSGSFLPAGQKGWFCWARTGSDITTPAAAYGSNSFVFHTC